MFPLKSLSNEAIPRALEKADRYRLLNEPVQAESICLDILATEPDNQPALLILLLALTDQFGPHYKMGELQPHDLLPRLKNDYDRAYYAGIVAERQAEALLDQHASHSPFHAHDLLSTAMAHYELAASLRPPGNDDALLRWNTVARLLNSPGVKPRPPESDEPFLE